MADLLSYWWEAWTALHKVPPLQPYTELCRRYGEPQRHYHTLQHLQECFATFDELRPLCTDPAAVLLALWFHDAVYDPHASDNEALSAGLAVTVLAAEGATAATQQTVSDLVMATRHVTARVAGDTAVLLDIDLSILAAAPPRFAEYEQQIRQEYAWVAPAAYRQGRAAVLRGFLERPRIFHTERMLPLEPVARQNLQDSLDRLARS